MDFYKLSRIEVFSLANKIKRSKINLYNISKGYKKMGTGLAKEINAFDPRFKLSDLRPDIWGDS